MKTQILSLLLFFGLIRVSIGQNDTLNRFDSNGKKHGKWIVYLNYYWTPLKDSSNAVYYRYTIYDHGEDIYPMGAWGRKKWKLEPSPSNSQQHEKMKLLDGEYKWIDKKGRTNSIHYLKKGEYVWVKGFYSSGKLENYSSFTKTWYGHPNTYSIYEYDKKGNGKYYFMQKVGDRWGLYQYPDTSNFTIKIDTIKVVGDSTFAAVNHYKNGRFYKVEEKIIVTATKTQTKTLSRTVILHGKYIQWYPNGQKITEGKFYYGNKIGQWKYWDRSGKEITKEELFKSKVALD